MPLNDPVPSVAADVLERNVQDFDRFVVGAENTFVNRLGVEKPTVAGIIDTANEAIATIEANGELAIQALRVVNAGSFEDGATLTARNEVLYYLAEQTYYRWDGALPKTVAPASTPASTGGVGVGAWVDVGDAALRSELAGGTAFIDGYASKFFLRKNESDIELTVGTGGDHTSLNGALLDALRFSNSLSRSNAAPLRVTVRILSGTVISEQILLERGIDMGHIEIVSDDPVVLVDGSGMNRRSELGYIYVDGEYHQFSSSFMFAGENCTLPIIGCLFDMQGVGPNYAINVAYNSKALVRIGCGVINSGGGGIIAFHGSHVVAHGSNFSNARDNAVSVFRGSFVDFRDGNGDNAGVQGIYCGSNSRCEALNCTLKNAGDKGIEAYGGSVVHARNVDVSGAGSYGLYARDGSIISTRSPVINNTGSNAIYTLNGGKVYAPDAQIIDSGNYGIYADEGGEVFAPRAVITNPQKSAIWAINSSKVNAYQGAITNSNSLAILAGRGSIVNFEGGTIDGTVGYAIQATSASNIAARYVEITNCGGDGIVSLGGSTIDARDGIISSPTGHGIRCDGGSRVAAPSAQITNCGGNGIVSLGASNIDAQDCIINSPTENGIRCESGSKVAATGAQITGAGGRSILCSTSGIVDADNSTLTGSTLEAVQAGRLSQVNVNDSTIDSSAAEDLRVTRGGIIAANGVVGATLSQTANTITSSGIIFQ